MKGNKRDFSKDIINLEIKSNKDKKVKIEIEKENDNDNDNDDGNEYPTCGTKDKFKELEEEIKLKKQINKQICNKCKKEKSNYFIRSEFVCQ
jgi:hypothetical protein